MGRTSDLGCFGVNMCILCYVGDQNLPVAGKWSFISSLFENELFNQNWSS